MLYETDAESRRVDLLTADVRLVARDRGNLLRQEQVEEMEVGGRLIGKYNVTKVKRQNDCRMDFWKGHSGRNFPEECRIMECTNEATVGRRMWVRGQPDFVFVVPICNDLNEDKDLYHPNYEETNKNTCLVAHDRQGARMED